MKAALFCEENSWKSKNYENGKKKKMKSKSIDFIQENNLKN
jgi:hypothetical protein